MRIPSNVVSHLFLGRKNEEPPIFFVLNSGGLTGRIELHTKSQHFIIIGLNFLKMNKVKRGMEEDAIAHEIAHYELHHYKNPKKMSRKMLERDANDLIKSWGFRTCPK